MQYAPVDGRDLAQRGAILRNIQALRALAVTAVVLGHLQPLAEQIHPALAWVGLGRAGVDLFFVISGFIMVYTTERAPLSAGAFALRRMVRIVPLYWLVTAGVFLIALIAPKLLGASRPDPAWLLKSLCFIPFDKGDGSTNPLIPVGWTLNYEMFFYTCLALALFMHRGAARYIVVAGFVAALGLVGFGLKFDGVLLNFYTRPILIEFALGILLGLLFGRLPRLSPTAAQYGKVVLGALVALLATSGVAHAEGQRVLVAGASSLCIVGTALTLERNGRFVRSRLVLLVGDASYAIYLTHIFVTQVLIIGAGVVGVHSAAGAATLVLAGLVASIATGVLTFHVCERPLARRLKQLVAETAGGRRSMPATG